MAFYQCPFCPFSDDDSSFLINHVGLLHPETEESPFLVKDDVETMRTRRSSLEVAGARGVPSGEDYIECECGETGRTV